MHKFEWFHVGFSRVFGLEEQWLFRYNDKTIARIVDNENKTYSVTAVGPDGHPIINQVHHESTVEQSKHEVENVLVSLGWTQLRSKGYV